MSYPGSDLEAAASCLAVLDRIVRFEESVVWLLGMLEFFADECEKERLHTFSKALTHRQNLDGIVLAFERMNREPAAADRARDGICARVNSSLEECHRTVSFNLPAVDRALAPIDNWGARLLAARDSATRCIGNLAAPIADLRRLRESKAGLFHQIRQGLVRTSTEF